MTSEQINQAIAKLNDAMQRDDENAGREAIMALGAVVIGSLVRIADAIEILASPPPSASSVDHQEG